MIEHLLEKDLIESALDIDIAIEKIENYIVLKLILVILLSILKTRLRGPDYPLSLTNKAKRFLTKITGSRVSIL